MLSTIRPSEAFWAVTTQHGTFAVSPLVVHLVTRGRVWGDVRRCPVPQLVRRREVPTEEERAFGRLARSRTAPGRVVERARIVDLAAHGWRVPGIAAEREVSQRTVRRWVKRFTAQGLAGLGDAPR